MFCWDDKRCTHYSAQGCTTVLARVPALFSEVNIGNLQLCYPLSANGTDVSLCVRMKFINKDVVKEITEYEVPAPDFLQDQQSLHCLVCNFLHNTHL